MLVAVLVALVSVLSTVSTVTMASVVSVVSIASIALTGCSDDEHDAALDDAADGGRDASRQLTPNLDARVPGGGEPLPACDRFASATRCAAAEVCKEIALVDASSGETFLYAACIERQHAPRGIGDPCAPFSEAHASDGVDAIYVDPCDTGLLCAADPDVRGSTSCQIACQTGAFGDAFQACASATAFCSSAGRYQEACRESDGCDPAAQTGCASAEACYLRVNDQRDGLLAMCLPMPLAPLPDHEACGFINECAPGSACLGSLRVPPAGWSDADFACRPACAPGADVGDDASVDVDIDAGADARSGCGSGAECLSFEAAGVSRVAAAPFGQCER